MLMFFLPIILIVISQVIYDVSAKAVNPELNAYACTTVIYTILAAFYFIIYLLFTPEASLGNELTHVNWAIVAYAIGSIGLESGYIFLYRAGWNISLGGMVCNILLALCMLTVGYLFYSETITLIQGVGVILCFGGLIVVFKADKDQKALDSNKDDYIEKE